MNNKTLKNFILGILFCFLSGCCLIRQNDSIVHVSDFSWELDKLRNIASLCGIPYQRSSDMDMKELLTEIKIKLNNRESYSNAVLTPQELNKISGLLYGNNQIINTINEYDKFIKKINGKQILILEEDN